MFRRLTQLFLIQASFFLGCRGTCDIPGAGDIINLTDWSGVVTSPDFSSGRSYPDLQDCTWSIRVSAGSRVKVRIEEFDLEEGTFVNNSLEHQKLCQDNVTITNSNGEHLFSGCGALTVPQVVTSSDRELTIEFHSDGSHGRRGFNFSYTGVCGGDFPEDGIIESPNFPGPPPPRLSCAWRIGRATNELRLLGIVKSVTQTTDNVTDSPLCWSVAPLGDSSTFRVSSPKLELCLNSPCLVYLENITLVYNVSSMDVEPLVGQVAVEFTDDQNCDSLCSKSCNLWRQLNSSAPTCQCLADSMNASCETCQEGTCVHGTCGNRSRRGYRQCICDVGYTEANFNRSLDACEQLTCQNGGVCKVNSQEQAYCSCPSGGHFIGQFCHIRNGSFYCQRENDTSPGSMLRWSDTLAGEVDSKPCPKGSKGKAKRTCVHDRSTAGGGRWSRPDLSQCVSLELVQLYTDVNNLFSDTMEKISGKILSITARLANATGNVSKLFPGDLLTLADVMKKLSDAAVDRLKVGENEAEALARDYAAAVGSIVDPDTLPIWRNIPSLSVEKNVSSVVASTQKLVHGVVKNLATTREGNSNRSGATSALTGSEQKALLNISVRNLDFQVRRLSYVGNSAYGMFNYGAGSSTVSLPAYELDGSHINTADHAVNVYLARFKSLASLLSIPEDGYTRQQQNASNLINSDVISAEVLSGDDVSRMRKPVELTFRLQNATLGESLQSKCVFMNMSATSYLDRWTSEGCFMFSSNETHVVCHCYHLTNFAVLMDIYNNQENIHPTHDAVLSFLSYIGGGLSIAACIVAICVFQYFRLSSDRVRIHQQLGVSIVLVQVLYICVGNTGQAHHTPVWGCRVLAILMHYSLTAMFCWMLVEGIHLYMVLVRVFKNGSHIKKYSALGWGVPLIVVGISVAVFSSRYGTARLCWLDTQLLLVCFVPTVGLVLMINTVVLVTVIRVMVKSNSSSIKIGTGERNALRASLKATLVLLPLLGLTWVLGFLAIRHDQSKAVAYIFTYLFTVTNSCQGVFFLVVHCLLNVEVRQACERRFGRTRRMSLVETTSCRLRKLSENDIFTGNRTAGSATTRSTLTDLSVVLPRLSFKGHSHLANGDKHSISGLDDSDGLSHAIPTAWHSFTTGRLPEPDYPRQQDFPADDRFGIDNPILFSSQDQGARDDVIFELMTSRRQRNPVQCSNASDLSL